MDTHIRYMYSGHFFTVSTTAQDWYTARIYAKGDLACISPLKVIDRPTERRATQSAKEYIQAIKAIKA